MVLDLSTLLNVGSSTTTSVGSAATPNSARDSVTDISTTKSGFADKFSKLESETPVKNMTKRAYHAESASNESKLAPTEGPGFGNQSSVNSGENEPLDEVLQRDTGAARWPLNLPTAGNHLPDVAFGSVGVYPPADKTDQTQSLLRNTGFFPANAAINAAAMARAPHAVVLPVSDDKVIGYADTQSSSAQSPGQNQALQVGNLNLPVMASAGQNKSSGEFSDAEFESTAFRGALKSTPINATLFDRRSAHLTPTNNPNSTLNELSFRSNRGSVDSIALKEIVDAKGNLAPQSLTKPDLSLPIGEGRILGKIQNGTQSEHKHAPPGSAPTMAASKVHSLIANDSNASFVDHTRQQATSANMQTESAIRGENGVSRPASILTASTRASAIPVTGDLGLDIYPILKREEIAALSQSSQSASPLGNNWANASVPWQEPSFVRPAGATARGLEQKIAAGNDVPQTSREINLKALRDVRRVAGNNLTVQSATANTSLAPMPNVDRVVLENVQQQPFNRADGGISTAPLPASVDVGVSRTASATLTTTGSFRQSSSTMQNLPQHLASTLSRMNSPEGQFSLRLNPQNLGVLEVKFQKIEGELNIALIARESGTRDLLDVSLPRLRSALADAGVEVANVDVSHEKQSNSGRGRFGSSPNEDSNEHTRFEHDHTGEDEADSLATALNQAQAENDDLSQGFYITV